MSVRVLDCKYAGAVAWGKNYPSPGHVVTHAKNGSAPGYVRKAIGNECPIRGPHGHPLEYADGAIREQGYPNG